MTSMFFAGTVPLVKYSSLSSTCLRRNSPYVETGVSEKQSTRAAIEHLLARYLETRPLFLVPAFPMKLEWKSSPYLGVLAEKMSPVQKIMNSFQMNTANVFVNGEYFRMQAKRPN